jgi:hypothetical protein
VRRFDTIYENLRVGRMTIDLPNVPSNGTVTVDTAHAGLALGTHIISWAPVTDATTIEDLIINWLIVADDLIRTVLFNPTGGAIDPDSIDFEFIVSTVNPLIDP